MTRTEMAQVVRPALGALHPISGPDYRDAMRTPITAVIWDWNGTLLDDVDQARTSMNAVLAALGLPTIADRDAYRSVFGFPIREFYGRLGIDVGPDGQFDSAARSYLAAFDRCVAGAQLQPHARAVLADLATAGLDQVLISASTTQSLERQLAPHRLDDLLPRVHGITDPLDPSKHHLVEQWLAVSDHDPAAVVMVGDTNHDREIAESLGMGFIGFDRGH